MAMLGSLSAESRLGQAVLLARFSGLTSVSQRSCQNLIVGAPSWCISQLPSLEIIVKTCWKLSSTQQSGDAQLTCMTLRCYAF